MSASPAILPRMPSAPSPAKGWTRRRPRPGALPGFGLAMGWTIAWLTGVVLLPLGALVLNASQLGPAGLLDVATEPRVVSALRVSFGVALAAAAFDVAAGVPLAWVLSRYRFPLRRAMDALVDLPFALPTAVAGIALAALYAPNGWIGAPLAKLGIKVAFTPLGIFVALAFVGLPFVVRTVQPLVQEIDREVEEASATLGAGRLQTLARVVLPPLLPAILTGFTMAFARAVGEYGSVIFIAGNLPYVSEIAPLLIVVKLEEYDYAGATGIATIMLVMSFVMLLAINFIQGRSRRRLGHA